MPLYQSSPINKHVQQAVPGLPAYLLGSYNYNWADTQMNVTAVQLVGTTATVFVTVTAGQLPIANQLVSIAGAVPSYFNVTNAKITAVSFVDAPEDGIGSISFVLTNAQIGKTASPGFALAPQIQVGEALVAGASSALALQANTGPNNAQTIRFDVTFPTLPGAATVTPQAAMFDVDAEYVNLSPAVATIVGGTPTTEQSQTYVDVRARFVRFNVTGLSGAGAATIIAKVLV
jgi:hypothetical protein